MMKIIYFILYEITFRVTNIFLSVLFVCLFKSNKIKISLYLLLSDMKRTKLLHLIATVILSHLLPYITVLLHVNIWFTKGQSQ